MTTRLIERRTVWWPTLAGWSCLLALVTAPVVVWWFGGESFLSRTQRQPADVLVVESWIGSEGMQAAAKEFNTGHYHYLVVTGGLTGESWSQHRWNEVEETIPFLVGSGVPRDRIIGSHAIDTDNHRTFEMAVASWRALRERGIQTTGINVFTLGVHARRSRLVFAKVFASSEKVGVISWSSRGYFEGPWRHSSPRAQSLLKETVGYLYELLLNSGRLSNAPDRPESKEKSE